MESEVSRLAAKRPFVDGFDLHVDEYDRWKRMQVVKGLLGIFELDDSDYFTKETRDLLPKFGLGACKQLFHDVEVENTGGLRDDSSSPGGWTSAVRDQYGKVRPIIFIRRDIPNDSNEDLSDEGIAICKLLVLIHEMGHADDIRKSINYNHVTLELNIVDAELYAHDFVVRHCRKLGYRLMLDSYLSNIEKQLTLKNEAARIAAERFIASNSLDEIRKFCFVDDHIIKMSLVKSGRMKEFLARQGAT